jgi:hypothetical protein
VLQAIPNLWKIWRVTCGRIGSYPDVSEDYTGWERFGPLFLSWFSVYAFGRVSQHYQCFKPVAMKSSITVRPVRELEVAFNIGTSYQATYTEFLHYSHDIRRPL